MSHILKRPTDESRLGACADGQDKILISLEEMGVVDVGELSLPRTETLALQCGLQKTRMSHVLRRPTDESRLGACADGQDKTLISLGEMGVVDEGERSLPRTETLALQYGLQKVAEPQDRGRLSQDTVGPWRAKECVAAQRTGAGKYDNRQQILQMAVEILKLQCRMIEMRKQAVQAEGPRSQRYFDRTWFPVYKPDMDIWQYLRNFERCAEDVQLPKDQFCRMLRLVAGEGPLFQILLELNELQKNNYEYLKTLIQQRLGVTAESARVRFQQLKRSKGQTFTQYACELSKHLDSWMQLAHVGTLEDLRQLLLIEKLFGGVPPSVLKFSSECRSADVFQSALKLDKLIANAFGGQIPQEKKEDCGVSRDISHENVCKKESFQVQKAETGQRGNRLKGPGKVGSISSGGRPIGDLKERPGEGKEYQRTKLKQVQEIGKERSKSGGLPQHVRVLTRAQVKTKAEQKMAPNHQHGAEPDESVKQDGLEEKVEGQSRDRKIVQMAAGLQINREDYIKQLQEDPELQKCREFANRGVEGYFFKHQLLYREYVEKGCDPAWGKRFSWWCLLNIKSNYSYGPMKAYWGDIRGGEGPYIG